MNDHTARFVFLLICLGSTSAGFAVPAIIDTVVVFDHGTEGYHTFRIPALARTHDNTLLAFCEGRKNGMIDTGDIDLVLRRSQDGGRTWSPLILVVDDAANTCGNPVPVVLHSGEILLVLTKNDGDATENEINRGTAAPRSVWLTRSKDDGVTWSTPEEISAQVRKSTWRWYATGPGHGIQIRTGRIVVPANHSLDETPSSWHSHVIISDDGGQNWSLGGEAESMTNESTVAELSDGRLYLNMRNYRGSHRRAISFSDDGGAHWSTVQEDPALTEPVCQASVLAAGRLLLFANPASEKRERLTVRISPDGGRSWPNALLLHDGPSAYSDLAALADGAACLYECGEKQAYEHIAFTKFILD